MSPESTPTPSTAKRLFGGYGPLIGFTAMIAAISLLVPTVRQEVLTKQAPAVKGTSTSRDSGSATAGDPTDTTAGSDTTAAPGTSIDEFGNPVTPNSVGGPGAPGAPKAAGPKPKAGGTGQQKSVSGVSACTDRAQQDPSDPYSPPCYSFSGDNQGATTLGVTKDTITLAVRSQTFSSGFADALAVLAGAKLPKESQATIDNTLLALTDYFNTHYNFYGRKLKLVIYDGKGDLTQEILSKGKESAEADALKVASEIKAFADVGAITPPYADGLSKRQIVNIGAPYVSQNWLTARKPYSWSPLTDCTRVVKSVVAYYLKKMNGKAATMAGGSLANQPRKIGVLAPTNSWYQECVNDGLDLLASGGVPRSAVFNEPYDLDLNAMVPQAKDKVQKLISNNITTVICGCDPIFLVALVKQAKQNNYHPEWLETGVALTDTDLVGQLLDPDVWNHAFGVSFVGATENIRASFAYRAFKQMRPTAEPSQAVQLIYPQLQMAAIGIQMAGPNLTPQSFQDGMFNYPKRSGPLGTWDFNETSYTPAQDAREIWYDRNAISKQTGDRGAWIESEPSKRYPIGQFPAGDPKVG